MRSWVRSLVVNIARKYAPAEFKKEADIVNSVTDVFGENIPALDFYSYPPAIYGSRVIEPEDILKKHAALVRGIKRNSMLTENLHDKSLPTFETIYEQVMVNYIKYIHNLPASESHHHCGPGGLVRHSLEVSEIALRDAESKYLAPRFALDIERDRRPRWLYATWLCGLIHDAGKFQYDMKVMSNDGVFIWNPFLESLVDWAKRNDVKRYKVAYISGRVARKHTIIGTDILEHILTEPAKKYIASSPDDLTQEIKMALNGYAHQTGYISDSVRRADVTSTSQDMVIVWDKELGAKKATMIELIMRAMRVLGKQWSYNRKNARVQIINGEVYLDKPSQVIC